MPLFIDSTELNYLFIHQYKSMDRVLVCLKIDRLALSSTHAMRNVINPIAESIKIPGNEKPVQVNTIVRLQGERNYTWLYFQTQTKPVLIAKNLKWFEDQLPDFVRLHKSELINPHYVLGYNRLNSTTLDVSLPNQPIIRVSRRRIDPVLHKLSTLAKPLYA